jgi:hypothetical protein
LALLQVAIVFWPEPRLIVWPDSFAYLTPAVDRLEFGYFSHAGGRGFIYPGWLSLLFWLSTDPLTIVMAQRMLVVLTFFCVAGAMAIVASPLLGPGRSGRVLSVAGAFWLAVLVLYPATAGLAHVIGPESLSMFLFAVVSGGAVGVVLTSGKVCGLLAFVTVLASSTLALVRPHWQFGALLLPVALSFAVPRGERRYVSTRIALAVGVSVVVLLLPEWNLQRQYDSYVSRVVGPRHLFCSNGDVIHRYLSSATDPLSEDVARALGRILTPDARAAARDWTLLGFNSDDCTHGAAAKIVADHFAGRASDEASYYVMTYVRAVTHEPEYLIARLVRNFAALAARPFPGATTDYWVRADDQWLRLQGDSRPFYRQWIDRHAQMFSGVIDLPSRWWPSLSRVLFAGAGLLLSVLVMLGVALAIFRKFAHGRLPMAFGLLVLCVTATNLLIAVAHTFEPRYVAMQAPMFVLLGMTATAAVWQNVVSARGRERRVQPATGAGLETITGVRAE